MEVNAFWRLLPTQVLFKTWISWLTSLIVTNVLEYVFIKTYECESFSEIICIIYTCDLVEYYNIIMFLKLNYLFIKTKSIQ